MRVRRKVIGAAVAVALVATGATGASRAGVLTIGSGDGSHAAATGIKVHGKWELVVRSHGKIVRVRRFENSLQTSGAQLLVAVLGRTASPGRWVIQVVGAGEGTTEPDARAVGFAGSNVSVTVDSSKPQLVLRGSVTATKDESIGQVYTGLSSCSPTTPPASCTSNAYPPFTMANLSSPVQVSQGQQISLTVRFTFS